MSNVVVTSNSSSYLVDFGDYHTNSGGRVPSSGVYNRSAVVKIEEWPELKYLHITMVDGSEWWVSYEDSGQNALIVDSVDGVAPTSLTDLKDKIAALIL